MTYLESEIIEDLKPFLNTELLKDLYCYKSINYRGQTTDSKNYFSEVISKFILDNSIDFNNIENCRFHKNTKCFNKVDIAWRRNHIAINLGQHMLIHGGLDDKDLVLNDMHILQYNEMIFS